MVKILTVFLYQLFCVVQVCDWKYCLDLKKIMPVFISWIAFLRYWSLTETEIFIWPLVMILMFNFIVLSLCLCWYYDIYLCLPVNMNNFRRFAGRLFIFQCNALRILTVIFGIWQSHIVLQKKTMDFLYCHRLKFLITSALKKSQRFLVEIEILFNLSKPTLA